MCVRTSFLAALSLPLITACGAWFSETTVWATPQPAQGVFDCVRDHIRLGMWLSGMKYDVYQIDKGDRWLRALSPNADRRSDTRFISGFDHLMVEAHDRGNLTELEVTASSFFRYVTRIGYLDEPYRASQSARWTARQVAERCARLEG